MGLKRVEYSDPDGRKKLVLLPEEASISEAYLGVPVGPPDLSELGLPADMEIRLNNELFYRHIFTPSDAQRKRMDILSAIQATLKLDVNKIVNLYFGEDHKYAALEEAQNQQQANGSTVRRAPRRRR